MTNEYSLSMMYLISERIKKEDLKNDGTNWFDIEVHPNLVRILRKDKPAEVIYYRMPSRSRHPFFDREER